MFTKIVAIAACSFLLAGCSASPHDEPKPYLPSNEAPRPISPPRALSPLERLEQSTDEVEQITWYTPKFGDRPDVSARIELYIGQKSTGGAPWLRLRITYKGPIWLQASGFTVAADEQRFSRDNLRFTVEAYPRVNYTMYHETYDGRASAEDVEMIKTVTKAKRVLLRCRGQDDQRTFEISEGDKAVLRDVLSAYKALGGAKP